MTFGSPVSFTCRMEDPRGAGSPASARSLVLPADRFAASVRVRRSSRPPFAHDRLVNIAELKRKSMPDLHDMADTLDVESHDALDRQDLIYRIEQRLLATDETLVGEGVLADDLAPGEFVACGPPDSNIT